MGALTWEDCGDASTHGHTVDVQPTEIVIGQDTTITGTGSTDKAISSGSFTLKMGVSLGIKETYTGKICEAAEFKMPLGIGTLSWAGMACPVAVGPATIGVGVKMASALPAALAKADVSMTGVDQDGEPALCVNTHLTREAMVSESVGATKCPGSGAWIHAKMQLSATAQASCDTVKQEITDRIDGVNGWYDAHNRGTYSHGDLGGDVSASRLTGDGKYTDHMTFVLTPDGSGCKIEGCSESQSTSVADFGTNYCNLKLLYCGTDEGCKVANADFANSGESAKGSAGAGSGLDNCLKVMETQV